MAYTLKKWLGQHFLHDENICRKIVAAVADQHPQQLLEIGPGGGAITRHLIQLPLQQFKMIEVDEEKVVFLKSEFPLHATSILHQSVLDADPPFEGPFGVVGNFPYNISTEIVFKLLDWKSQVEFVVGMFQKEVAQRLAAKPDNKVYGVTSVLAQAFFSIEYLFNVAPGCFNPPPKVMSGVILMKPQQPPAMKSETAFKLLVKKAFQQRRKQLRNPLKPFFPPHVLQQEVFSKRAENLGVDDYARLSFLMHSH